MRCSLSLAALAALSLTMSACGETPGCRAATRAELGAAGGAAAGGPGSAPCY